MSPDEVALEHVLWAAQDGQSPAELLSALGYPLIATASWDTVLLALRIAHRRIANIELKRAA